MTETDIFKHSTPPLYYRRVGALLFEPYAKHVVERASALRPRRILETAAGTGIVTRAVNEALPEAEIVGTDINPTVVEFASQHLSSDRVHFSKPMLKTCLSKTRRSISSSVSSASCFVTDALRPWDGKHATMSAHIATATR